jgi:hypothetical protein
MQRSAQRCAARMQRSAQRCAADPGSILFGEVWVPALRRTAEEALHRVRDTINPRKPHGGFAHTDLAFQTATTSSLRANGSRECAPDDRLHEAIHKLATRNRSWIASSLRSSQ